MNSRPLLRMPLNKIIFFSFANLTSKPGAREVFQALQASGAPVTIIGCCGLCYASPAVQKPDGSFCKAVVNGGPEQPGVSASQHLINL